MYYFNIELMNYVGYENTVSSVGILTDFTAPEPGLIVNASRDESVHEPCVQFTPDEWERRCVEDTPLDNHRYAKILAPSSSSASLRAGAFWGLVSEQGKASVGF